MNLFVVFVLFLCSVAFAHVEKMPDVQDNRDGRVYKTVQIGEQRWMAENLRYNVRGSVCYEKKDFNCEKYGRLYNWAMAMMLVDYYNSHSIQKLVGKYKKGKIHDICLDGHQAHRKQNGQPEKVQQF